MKLLAENDIKGLSELFQKYPCFTKERADKFAELFADYINDMILQGKTKEEIKHEIDQIFIASSLKNQMKS